MQAVVTKLQGSLTDQYYGIILDEVALLSVEYLEVTPIIHSGEQSKYNYALADFEQLLLI